MQLMSTRWYCYKCCRLS